VTVGRLHIVRDLLTGTTRFNELVRGNPGLSRALFEPATRSSRTCRGDHATNQDGGATKLTPAGRGPAAGRLRVGPSGARSGAFGEPDPDELDADLLLWWLPPPPRRRHPFPAPRFVIYVHFPLTTPSANWIVVEDEASLCPHPIRDSTSTSHSTRSSPDAVSEPTSGTRRLTDAFPTSVSSISRGSNAGNPELHRRIPVFAGRRPRRGKRRSPRGRSHVPTTTLRIRRVPRTRARRFAPGPYSSPVAPGTCRASYGRGTRMVRCRASTGCCSA